MKSFKTIALITGILVAGLAFSSIAQSREKADRTEAVHVSNHERHKSKDSRSKDKSFKSATKGSKHKEHKVIKAERPSDRAYKRHSHKLRAAEKAKSSKKFRS
jgi:hypothetical protein